MPGGDGLLGAALPRRDAEAVSWEGLNPPYRAIVADPPWAYRNRRGTQTRARRGRQAVAAAGNYETLAPVAVASLPVRELAAPDAALFLWVTVPLLFSVGVPEILASWGFSYVTLLTWVKTGAPGLGFSFRGHTEHVVYATRGEATIPPGKRESNVIVAPRTAHSVKPAAFYDLVERVASGPYLELFARQPRLGWDHWGNGYEEARP